MAAMAAAFLALSLALATANAVTPFRTLVSHPAALIAWGNSDTSSELSDEDGIVTQPLKAPAKYRHHVRHHRSQRKHLALGAKKKRVHHHRSRRARHRNSSSVTAHAPANFSAQVVAPKDSRDAHSNGTSKSKSGLVAWHAKVHNEASSEGDPARLSALDTMVYSAQAAPQIILDKEQKIGKLEERNDEVSVNFHKLDAAYREQQVKLSTLRRRFEEDQQSIARGSKQLEESFTRVSQKEQEREKLLQQQQFVEKAIEEEKEKNSRLLHALELKDHAESTLREQLTSLRKQVNNDQKNEISMESATKVELQNQTKTLEATQLKRQSLRQELKTLGSRLKAQQADKEDLNHQQEALTAENNRLTEQNEKLEHLQSEKVAQMKALQRKVHDDRAERIELQHELDTLENTGAVPQPSAADHAK